nr:Flp pilus assembly protein CpaB [Clostridioides sp.]
MRDKRNIVIGGVLIVASLLICFLVAPMVNKSFQSKEMAVRVTKPINKGDKITSDEVKEVEVGKYNLPESTINEKKSIVGKYALVDMVKGDSVLKAKVSDAPLAEDKYLYGLDGDQQAISITIKNLAAGLSGKIQTGDVISIIATGYGENQETITPPELQYVRVLSVTNSKGADRKSDTNVDKGSSEDELPTTITLKVNSTQAKLLAKLEEESKMHVSLKYRGTDTNAQKFIDEQERVINTLNLRNTN